MIRSLAPALGPHPEPFFTVDPMHPLLIHHPAFPAQHRLQSEIPKPGPGLRQLPQPHAQGRVVPFMSPIEPRGAL